MNAKKLLIALLTLTLSISSIFSQNIIYLNHYEDQNSNLDKFSYEIENLNSLKNGDNFKLEIYKDDILIDDNCNKNIQIDSQSFYVKLICESDKLTTGNYVLVGQIIRDNKIIEKKITKIQNSELGKSTLNYQVSNNETKIEIEINSNEEDLQIIHEIPKEIIEYIDENTKNKLIQTDKDFIIIENDPIIAWNIDKAPEKIEYTIPKKTQQKDLDKMQIKIEKQTSYKYFTYILYLIIIIIIAVVIKPVFKKTKITKKKSKSK